MAFDASPVTLKPLPPPVAQPMSLTPDPSTASEAVLLTACPPLPCFEAACDNSWAANASTETGTRVDPRPCSSGSSSRMAAA